MTKRVSFSPGRLWSLLADAFSSFGRHNDLSAAASLAFTAMLALIPALFLLTVAVGAVIGSSAGALAKTQELLKQLIPAYSREIMQEVRFIEAHRGTISLLNGIVLLLSATPFVAELRLSLRTVFHLRERRPFLIEKLFDIVLSILFLVGLSSVAAGGVLLTLARHRGLLPAAPILGSRGAFLLVACSVFVLYFVFARRTRPLHLLVGTLVTTLLWFSMRPAFHLFLMYNPHYGFAFGSFKSLFIVIIWIYFSLVVFLLGAEVAASLGREDTAGLLRLMEGKRNIPLGIVGKYAVPYPEGSVIFAEGDAADAMYVVLSGRVSIRRKGDGEAAVVGPGGQFGGTSFLLSSHRAATAIAGEDVVTAAIGAENINALMNDYPEFVVKLFRETMRRMRTLPPASE